MDTESASYKADYFQLDESILHIRLTGSMKTSDDVLEFAHAFAGETHAIGVRFILVDEQYFQLNVEPLDAIEVAKQLTDAFYQANGLRIAVYNATHNNDINKYFDLVLSNHAIVFKEFKTKDEAIKWLHNLKQ